MRSINKSSRTLNFKKRLYALFKLSHTPAIKVYNGYGNQERCVIFGHAFQTSPIPRKKFRKSAFINFFALLRLFMVKPLPRAQLRMEWEGSLYYAQTEKDGFFRFTWSPSLPLDPGWHSVKVELCHPINGEVIAFGKGQIVIPFSNQFAFISDIDDTFLISHSSRLRKRLHVLLTKNARSRKSFDGVVNHYQLLSMAHAPEKTSNPFFFVSSSEWNLYDSIMEFSASQGLPPGVYLLAQIKKFREVFKTGQNKHATKFMRIARVLEAYPHQQFVLLGDDTQEDPYIYASIIEHFKDRIFAVYIRHVEKKNRISVEQHIQKTDRSGIFWCYFTHSSEAVIHSKSIGLII